MFGLSRKGTNFVSLNSEKLDESFAKGKGTSRSSRTLSEIGCARKSDSERKLAARGIPGV